MEHDECRPGTPVWHTNVLGGNVRTRPAIVVAAPLAFGSLVGIAIQDGETWRPSWVSARVMRRRALPEETIPAFFAAAGDIAQQRLSARYTDLMHLIDAGATQGGPDDEIESEALDLELRAGRCGLLFAKAPGRYVLVSMTECERAAFDQAEAEARAWREREVAE